MRLLALMQEVLYGVHEEGGIVGMDPVPGIGDRQPAGGGEEAGDKRIILGAYVVGIFPFYKEGSTTEKAPGRKPLHQLVIAAGDGVEIDAPGEAPGFIGYQVLQEEETDA